VSGGPLVMSLLRDFTLPIATNLGLVLLALSVGMCLLAGFSAMFKVIHIDPSVAISR
jgi:hypothetical protein